MQISVIDTPQLGDRSYLVHDGAVALVIDPQRDIDRVERVAEREGVDITHVAETHLHNDYVTGGFALAARHDAQYLVSATESVQFERTAIRDGDVLRVGQLRVEVVATPGHTRHHVSYVVSDDDEQAVFSGGSLLYGSVGRTDLIDPAITEELTHAQYASVRRLVKRAGADAGLYPTHGFGSFCSSGPATGADTSTLGEQADSNHALTDHDEQHFVETLIAGLTAYPSYYAHMGPANAAGPEEAHLDLPAALDPAEVRRRLEAGEWIVDLRHRVAFADCHLRGSLNLEYGDGASFTTFLGWVLPWGERLVLAGEQGEVEAAVRDLSRIGIDSPDVSLGSSPRDHAGDAAVAGYPSAGWDELRAERSDGDVLLDVRRRDEYAGSHLADAINVPLHELLSRIEEVPAGRVWVHCGSGYRAAVAASILQRAGREVVHLDALFGDAPESGLAMVNDEKEGR